MNRVLWAMTGSGDRLEVLLEIASRLYEIDTVEVRCILSKAANEVLYWYGLEERVKQVFDTVMVEESANNPFVAGPLQVGYYSLLIVAPLTANSAAKIAHGIADTLVTNAVAQALKGGQVPVVIFPVDQDPDGIETVTPNGDVVRIQARAVDLQNVDALRNVNNIQIARSPEEIGEKALNIIQKGFEMTDS